MAGFLKNILWATDFSEEAGEALAYTRLFARTFSSKVTAVHAVPDFSPALYATSQVIKDELARKINRMKKDARQKIEAIGKAKKIPFKKIIVVDGDASKKIVEAAEKEKSDMIIIGRRGLSALEKIFIGSVANRVLRNSHVPVLVTKKKEGRPRVKKILVPTDFSRQEEVERNFAWKLAKKFDASLTLLHVLELHDALSPKELDELFDSVLSRLKQRKKREKEDIKVTEEVHRAINASIGIVEFAESRRADLIIISTCASRLERFFLGSTTEKVISHTGIPVFAIPPGQCE